MLFNYNLTIILYLVPVFLVSLTIHEFAHGYVSYRLGDPTAKMQGRLTLNPIKHIDPLGALMFLFTRLGWAKPVPINPSYYKNYKLGTLLVSLAGPLSNILISFISYILLKSSLTYNSHYSIILSNLLEMFYSINIGLAAFNILPIPPLDGSKILSAILPLKYYYKVLEKEQIFSIVFLALILIFPGVLTTILSPVMLFIQIIIVNLGNLIV